ncbi:DUF4376 domain-containing protein [Roseovarius sp. E0-M6]|uniref:DUF4376 domain-containing protein n=1 Tax=Roseovarius sp. E0-M6 TaxID=3127118 RepID=UPI00300FAE5F
MTHAVIYDPNTGEISATLEFEGDEAPTPQPHIVVDSPIGDPLQWTVDLDTMTLTQAGVMATDEAIMVERDRRIHGGFDFQGNRFQTRPEDLANISGAASSALLALSTGTPIDKTDWAVPGTPFAWIAEDNSLVSMDVGTMLAFSQAAMQHKATLIFRAKALKENGLAVNDLSLDAVWADP